MARRSSQYRLFFRYHLESKIIVYAWVNDEDSKRAYESGDDAYCVFRKMLENGHPTGRFRMWRKCGAKYEFAPYWWREFMRYLAQNVLWMPLDKYISTPGRF